MFAPVRSRPNHVHYRSMFLFFEHFDRGACARHIPAGKVAAAAQGPLAPPCQRNVRGAGTILYAAASRRENSAAKY